jgi:hypothetical protein
MKTTEKMERFCFVIPVSFQQGLLLDDDDDVDGDGGDISDEQI